MRRLRSRVAATDAGLVVGVVATAVVLLATMVGPLLLPFDPLQQDLSRTLLPPGSVTDRGVHLFGTDDLGRDVLARTLAGGRIPILVGLGAVACGGVFGTVLGLAAGFLGGWADNVLSRLADVQLSLPSILVALTLLAFSGQNIAMLVAVIAVTGWPAYFRLVRSATLQLRVRPFVDAAISSGQSRASVVVRHLLPNVRVLLVMCVTLDFSRAILMEAGLSFLGLGVSPPSPDWGLMVSQGQSLLTIAWWMATFPGIAIVVLVLAVNLVGDWLSARREVADAAAERQVLA
ncbi:ABC transporter permease [Microbacterium betulae]|uniref:ABC transporter permease n=1 Tax=Microbacterium betulae TaxID=2981139 RepID=A0AA97I6R7_9MICO|nr:ABC transporter permease [Microbacterium sp. AB]WOF23442.1 ABC transporter permease [Microbacterium sp. AB]